MVAEVDTGILYRFGGANSLLMSELIPNSPIKLIVAFLLHNVNDRTNQLCFSDMFYASYAYSFYAYSLATPIFLLTSVK